MNIAKLIKQYRTEAGFTQQQVADKLFVAKNTYNQYENGTRKIESEMFMKILGVLGIRTDFRYEQFVETNEKCIVVYKDMWNGKARFQIECYSYDPIRKKPFALLHVNGQVGEAGWLMNREAIELLDFTKNHYKDISEVFYLTYEDVDKEQLIREVEISASLTCSTSYLTRLCQSVIEKHFGFIPMVDVEATEDYPSIFIDTDELIEGDEFKAFYEDMEAKEEEGTIEYLFAHFFKKKVKNLRFNVQENTYTIQF